ncbi:hypothetical protein ABZ905_31690 [Streptomyces parvus]|uniref:hypothetical protein n=1 Tax=Streptomyces parvus TaxID=66428 RepID=UPI0033D62CA1
MSPIDSITVGAQVGVILPLFTAVVQRPAWSAKAKRVVASVAALIAGVLTVAVDGGWAQFQHGTHTTLTVLGVLAAAQTSYDLLWKPTRVAPAIETVTSPKAAMKAG